MLWYILLSLSILILISDYWLRHVSYKSLKSLPLCNMRSFPLIGQAYIFVGSDKDRMRAFIKMGRESLRCGGIARFWFARRLFLIITDPAAAEMMLRTFLEKDDLMKIVQEITGDGSIFAPVSIWRPRRKNLTPAFSPKVLKQFVRIFAQDSEKLVEKLKPFVDGEKFSVFKYMASYTVSSVCETNLGVKISDQSNTDQEYLRAIDVVMQKLADRVCQPWLQVDFLYKMLPHFKIMNAARTKLRDFVLKAIKLKREEKIREIENNPEVDRDQNLKRPATLSLLDKLLEIPDGLSDVELRDECIVITVAGTDTSAVGASFTLCMLARYPDVQEKVYKELQEVFGDSMRSITNEDLSKLSYTDAVIKETLRLYPPVPVIVRKVDKTFTLSSGETLVPGMGILINIWGLQRNPKYWGPDAEIFRPERFLDASLTNLAAFMPFSAGPRNCLGYQYAMMSMKTAISSVLRNYTVLLPENSTKTYRKPEISGMTRKDIGQKLENKIMRLRFDIMMKDVDDFNIKIISRHRDNTIFKQN